MEHIFFLQISDSILLAIIALIATFLTLSTQILMAIIQNKTRKEQKDLSVKVDGRLTDLMEETKKRYEAEGREAGVAQQKAEAKIEIASAPPIELKIGKLEVEMKPPTIPPEEKK